MYRLQQLRLEARQALHESQAQLLLTPTVGATYAIQDPMPCRGMSWERGGNIGERPLSGICGKIWLILVEGFQG